MIFDAGGVLHESRVPPVHKDIQDTLGIDEKEFTRIHTQLIPLFQTGKMTEGEYLTELIRRSGIDAEVPEYSLFERRYKDDYRQHKEVLEIVKELKIGGIKVAVLSNNIPPHYNYSAAQGTYDDFEVQVFSHEVGTRKPEKRIFDITLDRLQVKPEKTVFVDDIVEYVQVAKKYGLHGLLYESAIKLRKDLESFGLLR